MQEEALKAFIKLGGGRVTKVVKWAGKEWGPRPADIGNETPWLCAYASRAARTNERLALYGTTVHALTGDALDVAAAPIVEISKVDQNFAQPNRR